MSFDRKFYAAAEEEIKRRRTMNSQLQDRRIAEAEAKVPAIRDYRFELSKTGEKLANIILSGTPDAREKIKSVERVNLALQEKIGGALESVGLPKEYLDSIYTCSKCKDTGVYENRRCSCFMDIVKRLASEELNSSSPMQLCKFETFDCGYYPDAVDPVKNMNMRQLMKHNLDYCIKYAENFHLPNNSILMKGKTGLGKTHLSLAIADRVLEQGYSAVYGSAPDLFRKLEQEHFGYEKNDETTDLIMTADLLVLDDLGAEFDKQFYVSALYNILNTRYNSGKPIIVNTNLESSEIKQRYGDRITSRLFTMEQLFFVGKDIRVQKKLAKR